MVGSASCDRHVRRTHSLALFRKIPVTMRPERRKILREKVASASVWQSHIAKQIVKIVRQVGTNEISLASSREHLVRPFQDPRNLTLHLIDARQIQLVPKALRQPMRSDF
jgi:hypothetical protein